MLSKQCQSFIATVAGYARAIKKLAKEEGGKERFLRFLKGTLTRDIIEGCSHSKAIKTLANTLALLCERRAAHLTFIEG